MITLHIHLQTGHKVDTGHDNRLDVRQDQTSHVRLSDTQQITRIKLETVQWLQQLNLFNLRLKLHQTTHEGLGTLTLQKHFQLFAQVFKFEHKCQECVNIGSERGGGSRKF